MKIILFNNVLDYGGVSTYMIRMHNILRKNSIKSEIVVLKNEREKGNLDSLKYNFIKKLKFIREKCKEISPNIIITNNPLDLLFIKIANIGLKGTKNIVVIHIRTIMWMPINIGKFKKVIIRILTKIAFKVCDECIAVSKELKEEIISEGWIRENKIETIYNPVIDDNVLKKIRDIPIKNNNINIGIVGWVWDIKNQEEAIRAIKELNDLRYKLHIIGGIKDESYYKKLLVLINELNLQEQVIFEGIKENIFLELDKLDILILTSKTEALPNVIIEALSQGIPVIASNSKAGISEILQCGKCGIIYNLGEEKELAKKIKKVINSNDLYKQLSKNGLIRAKDFSCDKSFDKYNKLFNSLCLEENK